MLVPNRFKTKAVFVVAALSLTACGSNASISKKGATTSAVQTDKGANPGTSGQGTPASSGTPSSNPAGTGTQPVVTPPTSGSATPAQPNSGPNNPATQNPTPVTNPATQNPPSKTPQPSVGTNSAPAVPVSNPFAKASGCGTIEAPPYNFPAIPMEKEDYNVADLPYVSVPGGHKIDIVEYGLTSPGRVAFGSVGFVQDSMVLFKFPVHLNPKESITKLYNAYIQLDLTKLNSQGHADTEWICFLDQKACSGRFFEADEPSWQKTLNLNFWKYLGYDKNNLTKGEMNDAFTRKFTGAKSGKYKNYGVYQSPSYTFKIEDLIKGSHFDHGKPQEDVLAFIYDGVPANGRMDKDLRIVVSDDTRVSNAKLVLEFEEDLCKTFDLQPIATPEAQKPVPGTPSAVAPSAPSVPAPGSAAVAPEETPEGVILIDDDSAPTTPAAVPPALPIKPKKITHPKK